MKARIATTVSQKGSYHLLGITNIRRRPQQQDKTSRPPRNPSPRHTSSKRPSSNPTRTKSPEMSSTPPFKPAEKHAAPLLPQQQQPPQQEPYFQVYSRWDRVPIELYTRTPRQILAAIAIGVIFAFAGIYFVATTLRRWDGAEKRSE